MYPINSYKPQGFGNLYLLPGPNGLQIPAFRVPGKVNPAARQSTQSVVFTFPNMLLDSNQALFITEWSSSTSPDFSADNSSGYITFNGSTTTAYNYVFCVQPRNSNIEVIPTCSGVNPQAFSLYPSNNGGCSPQLVIINPGGQILTQIYNPQKTPVTVNGTVTFVPAIAFSYSAVSVSVGQTVPITQYTKITNSSDFILNNGIITYQGQKTTKYNYVFDYFVNPYNTSLIQTTQISNSSPIQCKLTPSTTYSNGSCNTIITLHPGDILSLQITNNGTYTSNISGKIGFTSA